VKHGGAVIGGGVDIGVGGDIGEITIVSLKN